MSAVPATLVFEAALQRPAAPRGAAWRFVVLPASASAKLPSRGLVDVEGTLAGQPFRATLSPDGEGGHWLKVERRLREAAGVDTGDAVALRIAPTTRVPAPRVPADVRVALAEHPAARATWTRLTAAARRDWIHWITSGKQAATRTKRIAAACDMLAAGKRRACCFDRSGRYSRGNMGAPVPAPAQPA